MTNPLIVAMLPEQTYSIEIQFDLSEQLQVAPDFIKYILLTEREGELVSEKRTRPVSSCKDRTSSVNKLFII